MIGSAVGFVAWLWSLPWRCLIWLSCSCVTHHLVTKIAGHTLLAPQPIEWFVWYSFSLYFMCGAKLGTRAATFHCLLRGLCTETLRRLWDLGTETLCRLWSLGTETLRRLWGLSTEALLRLRGLGIETLRRLSRFSERYRTLYLWYWRLSTLLRGVVSRIYYVCIYDNYCGSYASVFTPVCSRLCGHANFSSLGAFGRVFMPPPPRKYCHGNLSVCCTKTDTENDRYLLMTTSISDSWRCRHISRPLLSIDSVSVWSNSCCCLCWLFGRNIVVGTWVYIILVDFRCVLCAAAGSGEPNLSYHIN